MIVNVSIFGIFHALLALKPLSRSSMGPAAGGNEFKHHHHITSHEEDGSRFQGPLYSRNNTKIIDYTVLKIATL